MQDNPEEQFDDLFGRFESEEDKAILENNKDVFNKARKIQGLKNTEAGKELINSLRDDITKAMLALFQTRESRYVSELEANFNLLIKIKGADSQVNEILEWLDTL